MMDIKILLQALNQPWMIFPPAAENLSLAASRIFAGETTSLFMNNTTAENKIAEFSFVINAKGERIGSVSDSENVGVAVIDIKGAIMKYDYCGAPGTDSIGKIINAATQNPSISAIVLRIDSPGGSVSGTQALANIIKNSSKPIVVHAGMMCSAAMWLGSAASYRIAAEDTATIGSIGTMCSWYDSKAADEKYGHKRHEVYASDSTHKNIQFREAQGNNADGKNNYEPMIKTWLDPLNGVFTSSILENMPKVDKTVLNGSHYIAKDAIGKGLIDAIGTFEDAVNKAIELAKPQQLLTQITQTPTTMKWSKFLSFLGITAAVATVADIQLSDANADSLEALVQERDTLAAQVTQLTTERDAQTQLVSQRDATIVNLNSQITALGKKDGTDGSAIDDEGKDKADAVEDDAMNMDFQKELMSKI